MPISLFDDIKLAGFHSSIMTTFSVDPAFYDANLQFRLRSVGCKNNLLMTDAAMLQQALEQLPEAFAQVGRKYLISPIVAQGCFHPKIMIRYGKSKARMNLGSANATSAAWGSNRELVSTFHWSEGSGLPDDEVHRGLIKSAHDWLLRQLPATPDPDLRYKLELLEAQTPWLTDAPPSAGVADLSDGSRIDLFLSDPQNPRGIASRFVDQLEGEVEQLTVISPYWDDGLGALRRLHRDLGNPSTHIFLTLSDAINARQSTYPVDVPDFGVDPRFHPVGDAARQRFLHAKLILAQTREHDYVLYGSTNCTVAALGAGHGPGINCEAAIYRRLARGTVEGALGLDYSREIARDDILPPQEREVSPDRPGAFDPGRIERKGDRLVWSCPDGILPTGASFVTSGARFPVEMQAGARPFSRIGLSEARAVTVVRVELADGRTSRPVIVSDTEMLMAAAPHPMADGLRRKLEAVLNGEADLISLARDAHLLFDADGKRDGSGRGSGGGRRSDSASSSMLAGRDFDTPEEFRAALSLPADLHSNAIAHADNPTLQMLLRIVLRGIVHLEDSLSVDREDAEAVDALATGENQDDVGDEDGNSVTDTPPDRGPAGDVVPPRAPVAPAIIEQNRAALERALDRFDGYLDALSTSGRELDLDFVTRTLFMLHMMIHGCVHRYPVQGGEEQVLMPFSAIGTKQQGQGFLMRAAKFVARIWGHNFKDGLMARVAVDREQDVLPVPLVTLIILSRWILGAIQVEARQARGAKSFAAVLEAQVPRLWRMTSMFGPVDLEQVQTTVAQMAMLVGMEEERAHEIQATMRGLGAEGSSMRSGNQLGVA